MRIFISAADPHGFNADTDPEVYVNADPDPAGKMNADPCRSGSGPRSLQLHQKEK
jgi:hypothetical protein